VDIYNKTIVGSDKMILTKIRSSEEHKKYESSHKRSRIMVESRIGKENLDKKQWLQIGFCELCGRDTRFSVSWESTQNNIPNYREHLQCQHCKLPNRKRFILNLLKKRQAEDVKSVFMYEQTTDVFAYAKNAFNFDFTGSEFLGYDKKPGQVIDGIRHEDATGLSFPNNSFDILVSNDVFEHVQDIRKTLAEAYRVLREGGELLISVPFSYSEQTVRRAYVENNRVKHILPAVYHQNPLSGDGSLVFYDYGWDFLSFLKDASFTDAYMLAYYSMLYGYMGGCMQMVFVAHK